MSEEFATLTIGIGQLGLPRVQLTRGVICRLARKLERCKCEGKNAPFPRSRTLPPLRASSRPRLAP